MAPPVVTNVNTLGRFVALVEKRRASTGRPLWYRGCGDASFHKLRPSLYRHPHIDSFEKFCECENGLIERFKQRGIPFLPTRPGSNWECLFIMQHFGIPTRLLDWTENPFVAAYFALTSAKKEYRDGEARYLSDAAIWILDPIPWNQHSLKHLTFRGGILSIDDGSLRGYEPARLQLNRSPVAMYGIHNSARIVAQRGVFTIFGQDARPMETISDVEAFPEGALAKIVVRRKYIPGFLNAIVATGITDSVVFPDLDGFAKELKRHYGFEV